MLQHRSGRAADLHAATDDFRARVARINTVSVPAIVLASTQDDSLLDPVAVERAGLDVASRRSGGGAVWLAPGEQLWIDVFLPRADPLWDDDVSRSGLWLGQAWVTAFTRLGLRDLAVTTGGVSDPLLGRIVCFAATGPGEVTVSGRKLVGVSQRRSREGARFQCIVYRRYDPTPLLDLLAPGMLGAGERARLERVLRDDVSGLEGTGALLGRGPGEDWSRPLVNALVGSLP